VKCSHAAPAATARQSTGMNGSGPNSSGAGQADRTTLVPAYVVLGLGASAAAASVGARLRRRW
jgi:hypothetical protein